MDPQMDPQLARHREMCEINKLRIFDIKNNDINGASCQYYICKKNSNYKNNKKNLDRVYYKEKKMKLDKKQTYLNFFTEIKSIRKKTVNFLNNVKEKNKSIHCYGASTKGNVLLQYYKINNKVVDFVADRNPKKYNLYTPGTKIKIISEKQSRSLKPDYYLVLPWHFKKEILLREKMTRKQNSKFIFPLPKLKIYS